jgi:hypothetical protein
MDKKDIIDRLKMIAALKAGDMVPMEIRNDPAWAAGNWHVGMSAMLTEAINEIERLRKYEEAIKQACRW